MGGDDGGSVATMYWMMVVVAVFGAAVCLCHLHRVFIIEAKRETFSETHLNRIKPVSKQNNTMMRSVAQ